MQSPQRGSATLHAACAIGKAAQAKSLLDATAPWNEKAAKKKSVEDLMRCLAG